MTSAVLASSTGNARFKRQTRAAPVNDENENPFLTRTTRSSSKHVEPSDIAGERPVKTPKTSTKDTSTPTKHTIAGGRTTLSPTEINSLFKETKAVQFEPYKAALIGTPQTPRHRDALSKKVPVTPRHRVTVPRNPLTPRTPRTPSTPSNSVPTIYNAARQLFVRSANPGKLVGRERERAELRTFIRERVASSSGGGLYVSGPPGTGKSALVNEVCGDLNESTPVRTTYVNCMSMESSRDLYGKLVEDLCEDTDVLEGKERLHLQETFTQGKSVAEGVCLVVLDEIDHLLTLDLESLYALFEWSLQRSSRLILVGIANALDLTDRFLPRLKARNLKPQLLPFLPYTATQIASVITTRLKSQTPSAALGQADNVPYIHPAAIQLCSRKVAAQSGDLRKAFDICRRAIDLVEAETRTKHQEQIAQQMLQLSPSKPPLVENMNLSSPPCEIHRPMKTLTLAESLATLTPESAPKVTIAHMARISSSTFGNGTAQRLQGLNLQQKAALCALVALEKKKRISPSNSIFATPSKTASAAPTVRVLFEAYCGLCKRDGMLHPLSSTEFRDVLGSLETLSLVAGADGKAGSFSIPGTPSKKGRAAFGAGQGDERRVASCVGDKEIETAVEGVGGGILKAILSGEGL
ncbi:MAG: AAA ATPase [Candelina submexicana]|nr:MAG: AAA ATPase [Candelina submexicana]